MKKILLYAVAMAAVASCSEAGIDEIAPEVTPETQQMTISVTMASDASRVAVDEDNGWKCSWEDGDVLWAWAGFDNTIGESIKFTMVGTTDGKTASFTGAVPTFKYQLIYTGSDVAPAAKIGNINQNEGADAPILGSAEFEANEAPKNVVMQHFNTFVDLEMNFGTDLNGATVESVEIGGLDSEMDAYFFYNNPIIITDGATIVADGKAKIQFSALSTELKIGDELSIRATLNKDGVCSVWSKTLKATANFDFESGKYHPIACTMTKMEAYVNPLSGFSATSVPTANLWIVTDETATTENYAGLQDALIAADDNGRSIELIFPNLTSVAEAAFIKVIPGDSGNDPTYKFCDAITSVSMPNVTEVGNSAIYCKNITTISLPKAKRFSNFAIYGCAALTTISLPEAETFEYNVFEGCSALTDVSLPKATTFSGSAFNGCTALTTISLPVVTSFGGGYAFKGCTNLKTISLGEDGSGVNGGLVHLCDGCTQSEVNLTLKVGSSPDYTIDGNIITIGSDLYKEETTFKSITVKEPKFYTAAISDYTGSMTLPNQDTWIVTDEVISDAASYEGLASALNVAKNADRTIEVIFPNLLTVVTDAFKECASLTTISMPAATKFENNAFYRCTALTSVSLPKVVEFGEWAFYECDALETITLPAATTFGGVPLNYCDNLKTISLPVVTTFGGYAFSDNPALETLSLGVSGTGVNSIGSNFCAGSKSGIDLTIKEGATPDYTISGNDVPSGIDLEATTYTFGNITVK